MNLKHILEKNSPQILTGLGIAAFVGAAILAAKQAPKANEILEELPEEADAWTKVKAVAPIYAPVAGSVALGAGCVLASQHILTTRYAAVFALYSAADQALGRWQAATEANSTKKKFQTIKEEALPELPPMPPGGLVPGSGEIIFMDTWTGRYFYAPSVEFVKRAVNEVNAAANRFDWASLNEFYDALDIPRVIYGDEIGWGSGGHQLDIDLIPTLKDEELQIIQVVFKLFPKFTDDPGLYGE